LEGHVPFGSSGYAYGWGQSFNLNNGFVTYLKRKSQQKNKVI